MLSIREEKKSRDLAACLSKENFGVSQKRVQRHDCHTPLMRFPASWRAISISSKISGQLIPVGELERRRIEEEDRAFLAAYESSFFGFCVLTG
jgi:hypothetical protein